MASAVIHLCVANEINKKIKKDSSKILIGSIAPDIAKYINEHKMKSHFQDENNDTPNLKLFLNKYSNYLNDDFVLGYYIHLYTDYLWFKFFMPKYVDNSYIYTFDNEKIKITEEEKTNYLYKDYSNLNIKLIEDYNLTLDIFYNDIPSIDNIIEEIPMDKLNIIVDEMGKIIKNSKIDKTNIIGVREVSVFIDFAVLIIYNEVKLWL